jgi:large subunit ribosomal protein L28
MPRRCHLTGTHSHSGQNVSHSNRKSKRRFEPNLQHAHLHSEALGRSIRIRVSTRALRTVQKRGGLDAYLLSSDDRKLPPEALTLKRQVLKALH